MATAHQSSAARSQSSESRSPGRSEHSITSGRRYQDRTPISHRKYTQNSQRRNSTQPHDRSNSSRSSGLGSRSRSRERSGSEERVGARTRTPDRSRSRSRSRCTRKSQSRTRSKSGSGDRVESRSRNRSRERGRGRNSSWSRSRSRDRGQSRGRLSVRSTKIVVERLTTNINEDHLYEIFGEFGTIDNLDLPISRVSGTNRGSAYILFASEVDAECAISHMHEAEIDGATISVSIVLPHQKLSRVPRLARRGGPIGNRQPPPNNGGDGARRATGRFGNARAFDTYRPRSISQSRSRSPPRRKQGRYRSRSP